MDGARFMASSLSILADNLAKGIKNFKCKHRHDNKICKMCGIKYKYCKCCLEYTTIKDDLILYKYSCCNRKYYKKFDENVKKGFSNT